MTSIGAVCHTLNRRLHTDQLRYIIEHAEDTLLFFDIDLSPPGSKVCWCARGADALGTEAEVANAMLEGCLAYEELLSGRGDDLVWPELSTNSITSGMNRSRLLDSR